MSVTSGQLNKNTSRKKDFDYIVREQLQLIDSKLLSTEQKWGKNIISHELPQNLQTSGIKKIDAQRIVYSSIIRSLSDRGFTVKILIKKDCARLFVAWVTKLEQDEIEEMTNIINEHALAVPADGR
jgi:hypothetical protein